MNPLLDQAFQWTSPVGGIVTACDDLPPCLRAHRQLQSVSFHLSSQVTDLDVDNLGDFFPCERIEHDGFVNPIQKLRAEIGLEGILHFCLHPLIANRLARLDEAQAVARFIQTVVKTEELPVLLPAGDTARTPTYRDVCLLVRSRTALELYTDALDAAGVPYHLDTGRGFFVQQEIRDAAAILTALDDPSDEVAVVAALKAAPYAASDSELLEYSFTRTAPRPRFVLERGELPAEYDGPLRPLLEWELRPVCSLIK